MPNFVGAGKHGRIPAAWWTLNHRYNFDYEVHRLGAGERGVAEHDLRRTLGSVDDAARRARFQFVRDAPDIVMYMHAFRAELHMRMIKSAILRSSDEVPFMRTKPNRKSMR